MRLVTFDFDGCLAVKRPDYIVDGTQPIEPVIERLRSALAKPWAVYIITGRPYFDRRAVLSWLDSQSIEFQNRQLKTGWDKQYSVWKPINLEHLLDKYAPSHYQAYDDDASVLGAYRDVLRGRAVKVHLHLINNNVIEPFWSQ